MLTTERIQYLSKLPSPVLTAFLHIGSDDASKHALVPWSAVWLKNEAKTIVENLQPHERDLFREQLHRVEEFLHDRKPREKGLLIFAGSETWETVSLQVEVANELHWGKPALSQLLWLAAERRPHCIVVVDRSGARYFGYRLGEMSLILEKKFIVDISQWKEKDLGHVASPGVQKTYGSQRDVFDNRMDAQYKRLCRKTAEQAIHLFKKDHFSTIFLVGPERMVDPIAAQIPAELHRHVHVIRKDLGKVELHSLQEHLDPGIEKWQSEQELILVNDLLAGEQKPVLGIDETLAQLQNRRIQTLVLARDLDARLHQCKICGWTDFSADPVCSVCRGDRSVVSLREALPGLVAASETEIEVVSGDAARKLMEAGGIGAWLRQSKQVTLSRAAARAR